MNKFKAPNRPIRFRSGDPTVRLLRASPSAWVVRKEFGNQNSAEVRKATGRWRAGRCVQVLRVEALELQAAVGTVHQPQVHRKSGGTLDFQPEGLSTGRAARERVAAHHRNTSLGEESGAKRLPLITL